MPDILIILLALLGIFFIGLAFSAINLVKDVTRFIAISLLMLFVILLANRAFTFPSVEDLFASAPTKRSPITAPSTQNNRLSSRDVISGFSRNVGNFSDSLDAFVYGPQAQIGWQTLPEKLAQEQKTLTPTDRPVINPNPRRAIAPSPSPVRRPVAAWW
jgi:hypothetical protein